MSKREIDLARVAPSRSVAGSWTIGFMDDWSRATMARLRLATPRTPVKGAFASPSRMTLSPGALEQTITVAHTVAHIGQLCTERLKPGRRAPVAQFPQGSHRECQAGGDRDRRIRPPLHGGDKFFRHRFRPRTEFPRLIQDGLFTRAYLGLSCPVVG